MGSSGATRRRCECRGLRTATGRQCRMLRMAVVALVVLLECAWSGEAQQLELIHGYAHLEGSSASRGEKGVTPEYYQTLVAHDRGRMRRMLTSVINFPLTGDDDPLVTGLYYTQIMLGTPPRTFYVQVDTGSDVLWVNCAPCITCPKTSTLGIPLTIYDTKLSSTETTLGCSDPECLLASQSSSCAGNSPCSYSTLYGDGSSTNGYIVNDVMTFNEVVSGNSSNTTGSARVYFGCGYNQTGSLTKSSRAVDGLIGFGQKAISIPSQLAAQNKAGREFAHCLQGDNKGSGTLVIGNVLETNLSYTAIVPNQDHYNVQMLNIAVNGQNVTTPASFEISTTNGGVIMDSGTTLSYLLQPAYNDFLTAVQNAAPVPLRNIPDSSGNTQACFIYSGSIVGSFPDVTLYFAGGAEMSLNPKNYLFKETLTTGTTAYCLGWLESGNQPGYQSFSILGDNVLKDKLVVYDNYLQRIGWTIFDCTKPISVSSTSNSTPMSVLPGSSGSDASNLRPNSAVFLLCCIALAFSYALL